MFILNRPNSLTKRALLGAVSLALVSCNPEDNSGVPRGHERVYVAGASQTVDEGAANVTVISKQYTLTSGSQTPGNADQQRSESEQIRDASPPPSPHRENGRTGDAAPQARSGDSAGDRNLEYVLRACTDYGAGRDPKCQAACPWDVNPASDDDFARNCADIKKYRLEYAEVSVSEGGRRWKLQKLTNPAKPEGPLWFVPHDNENVAFDTAVYGLIHHGGVIVAVESGGQREFQGQDPNRNFDIGSGPLCPLQKARSIDYTNAILRQRVGINPIIALHSNTPSGNISITKPGLIATAYPGNSPLKSLFRPANTLVFISSPRGGSNRTEFFKWELTRQGVNVLWERVDTSHSDCSLSNYAALKGIENYFNIEVSHSDQRGSISELAQRKIVDIIMAMPPEKLNVASR